MREIAASLFMSLDGVMGAPDRWAFPYANDELDATTTAQSDAADALLLGRVTYQEFAAYWPHQEGSIADYINAVPKYVVSPTLDTIDWHNSTLLHGNVVEALTALKERPGKNISTTGSATLIQSLLRDGLLDELHLMNQPIVVGHGKRLFADESGETPFHLVDARTFSTGVAYLTYRPEGT